MNKEKTPEEKLLKLIRKKKKAPSESSGQEQPGHSLKNSKHKDFDQKKAESHAIRRINRILLIAMLCVVGYFLMQLFLFYRQGVPAPVILEESERIGPNLGSYYWVDRVSKDLYLREIENRDVFQSPWAIKASSLTRKEGFSNLNNELKLVGIVLDNDPKAIVVDVKSGQTLFLSEGEQLNEVFVEKISEDKVLLLHNGQEVELVK